MSGPLKHASAFWTRRRSGHVFVDEQGRNICVSFRVQGERSTPPHPGEMLHRLRSADLEIEPNLYRYLPSPSERKAEARRVENERRLELRGKKCAECGKPSWGERCRAHTIARANTTFSPAQRAKAGVRQA